MLQKTDSYKSPNRWFGLTGTEMLIALATTVAIVLLILAGVRKQQEKLDRAAAMAITNSAATNRAPVTSNSPLPKPIQ